MIFYFIFNHFKLYRKLRGGTWELILDKVTMLQYWSRNRDFNLTIAEIVLITEKY